MVGRNADRHISFSHLIETISRGGIEARDRLLDLAHHRPKLILPHLKDLAALLDSTRTPVRRASIEMLAALSRVSPHAMAFLLPTQHELLSNEPQNTIANHAIEILTNYARTSKKAAEKVIPILTSNIERLKPRAAAKISHTLRELTTKK